MDLALLEHETLRHFLRELGFRCSHCPRWWSNDVSAGFFLRDTTQRRGQIREGALRWRESEGATGWCFVVDMLSSPWLLFNSAGTWIALTRLPPLVGIVTYGQSTRAARGEETTCRCCRRSRSPGDGGQIADLLCGQSEGQQTREKPETSPSIYLSLSIMNAQPLSPLAQAG